MSHKTRTNRIHSVLTVNGRTFCGQNAIQGLAVSQDPDEVTCGVCQRYLSGHGSKDTGKIAFHAMSGQEGQYSRLEIEIFWLADVVNTAFTSRDCVQVEWQTDKTSWNEDESRTNSGNAWYGGTVAVKSNQWETQEKLHRLCRLVFADVLHSGMNPASVLVKLRNIGAVEVIYNSRHHTYIPVTEILPADIVQWHDDYKIMSPSDGVKASALAVTEDEARQLLDQALQESIGRWVSQEWYGRWVSLDRPVMQEEARPVQYIRAESRLTSNPWKRGKR